MARQPRLEMAGAHYHVTSRGVERRTIFRDDSDCEKFVELLGWTATHFGWRVHAWVLMGNHYHLLIETTQGNLSRSMQRLNQRYSVAFNRRHRRVGTFFQGRFKAMLVEWDEAGLEVSRYVHLNPVRVKALGMSRSQQDERRHGPQAGERQKPEVVRARLEKLRSYPWSSLRAYAGFESTPPWLDQSATLEAFRSTGTRGKTLDERQAGKAYVRWVEEAVREDREESPWEKLRAGLVLGTEAFMEKVHERLSGKAKSRRGDLPAGLRANATLKAIVVATEGERGEKVGTFRDRYGDDGRDLILWLARANTELTLGQLGSWAGGVGGSSVSMAIARVTAKLKTNRALARQLQAIAKQLPKCEM